MPHPEDNGQILTSVDDIRQYEYQRGYTAAGDVTAEEVAQLRAALATVTAERDAAATEAQQWENAWTEATSLYNVERANHDRLKAQYAALKAEFDQYKIDHPADPDPDPDPEPQPTTQLFGTSYGGADESKNRGRARVARIFFSGNCPSNPFADADYQKAYNEGVRHFVFSWKGTQTGAQLKQCFANIPQGVTAYGCYWHEPEDNIADGSLTLAGWKQRHVEHANAMREAGVIPVTILMAYTLAAASGRDVTDYYVGDDGFMFDAYFNPAKGKDNPEGSVDKIVAAAKAAGAKFAGLGETGVPHSVALNTTVDLVKRLRAKILATPFMRVNCYWPSGDFTFATDEVADAWFEN